MKKTRDMLAVALIAGATTLAPTQDAEAFFGGGPGWGGWGGGPWGWGGGPWGWGGGPYGWGGPWGG